MDDKIIATFCLCDDLLQAIHHQEDRQCQMNDAAVRTTACMASLYFRGNQESARAMLPQHGYIPHMLSKSRCSRRLHRIKDIFLILFDLLAQTWKTLNKAAISVIDSLPIAVCDNSRIRRSKIYSTEDFRGYQASKKRYFYGWKIHLMVTPDGQPVECFLTPGGFGDVDALKYYAVSGHCRYATALHGRQLSLLQMEGAYRGVERGQRPRSSLNARSVFRPPRLLRNLATDRGRVVRELLSHYNNDPLQDWPLWRSVGLERICSTIFLDTTAHS